MTFLVFVLGLVLVPVLLHFDVWMIGPRNVYQWWLAVVLLSALFWAVRARDVHGIIGAVLLIAFGGTVLETEWARSDPVFALAVMDVALGAWFILFGKQLWEYCIGGLFMLSVVVGALTAFGYITEVSRFGDTIYGLNHVYITTLIVHLAAVMLGAAVGDSGIHIRLALSAREMELSFARRGIARSKARLDRMAKF